VGKAVSLAVFQFSKEVLSRAQLIEFTSKSTKIFNGDHYSTLHSLPEVFRNRDRFQSRNEIERNLQNISNKRRKRKMIFCVEDRTNIVPLMT
jgi:hypothetical protein